MKLLAFAASSSRHSINKTLITYAIEVIKNELNIQLELEVLNLTDFELPLYSEDREKESGIPAKAQHFYRAIGEADAVMISFAEHNGLYTAVYKNLFDWASRIDMKVFQNKPVLHMAASVGRSGGQNVLKVARGAAPHFGAKVMGEFSLGSFNTNFDVDTHSLADEFKPVLIRALTSITSKGSS